MEDRDDERSSGSSSHMLDVDFKMLNSRNVPNSPGSTHSNASLSSDSASNESKSQEKICVVCGDIATGTHFAAMTCEGCKGFFRRSMKKCSQFTCAFENQCSINKSNRKHCQACRLQKCLSVGMNSNLIMSDESVNRKRELIRANREKKALLRLKKEQEEMEQIEKKLEASPQPEVQMMAEDKALIKMMLESHNQSYDFNYDGYEGFRGTDVIQSPPDPEEVKKTHVTLAWLVAGDKEKSPEHSPETARSKKKSVDSSDSTNSIAEQKKIKSELPYSRSGDGMSEYPPSEDVFSSLHGISQPLSGYPSHTHMPHPPPPIAPTSSTHRHNSYYSDASGSSTSTSPYSMPPKNPDFDPFAAGGFPSFDQAAGIMTMFGGGAEGGDITSMMGAGGFDSMSFLQGMFMNSQNDPEKPHSLFQHFCDIMTWGIKKVIEFCKCIPEFQELSTVDQINLLRGGCLEMLVLRSYFAFASDGNNYMSDKFQYSPTDFLQAGASSEFVEQYTKVHMRMRKMKLKVEEICLLIGLVLFSPDRPGVQNCEKVELMQKRIAQALRAYEYTNNDPEKACIIYSELLLLLPVLRTINVLFSNTILTLKGTNEDDMNPLILEVNN
ncbi:vitamin D3 receptor B-like isoform X1 [Styela clava]